MIEEEDGLAGLAGLRALVSSRSLFFFLYSVFASFRVAIAACRGLEALAAANWFPSPT